MAKKAGKIYVVGHKNPDTDSICSAIAYANLKREITGNDYIAKRAGQINEETHYVLQKFGVKVPNLLENVKLQVKDMDIHQIDGVGPNVSLKDTWTKMKENNIKTLPILRDEELLGVISTGDIATSYMDVYDNMILSKARTQYRNIMNTLDGEMVTGNEHGYFTKGKAAIGASSPELMQEFIEKDDLVITSDIPLADRSLTAGAVALNPRGGLYTHANIKNIMAMRDILEDLRASGEMTGGPKSFTPKNREEFANQLNRITAQYLRKRQIEELKREKIGSGSNK